MVHERRLERRRSLKPVEMATNGGLVCIALDRTFRVWGLKWLQIHSCFTPWLVLRVLKAGALGVRPVLIEDT